jgi:alkylated DNA nucleotide flippase Atl1
MSAPEITLARAVGKALLAYADEKSQQDVIAFSAAEAAAESVELPSVRGHRQQEIAELLVAAPDEGWKTSQVAHLVNMDQANAYLTLQALQRQAIVELVPGSEPQRWRLLPRYRQRQQILSAANLVNPGEFTTYGDISLVVYGHARGGQAVGQVAAKLADFPNPHRVLGKGGLIPPHWTDGTSGPEEAIRRLEGENVEVLADDWRGRFAHPRHYIDSDILIDRMHNKATMDQDAANDVSAVAHARSASRGQMTATTAHEEIREVAHELASRSEDGEFTLAEILQAMKTRGSRYAESTIRTHVTSRMCANAPDHHGVVYQDFWCIDRGSGRYRIYES